MAILSSIGVYGNGRSRATWFVDGPTEMTPHNQQVNKALPDNYELAPWALLLRKR